MEQRERLEKILCLEDGAAVLRGLEDMAADGSLFRLFPALEAGAGKAQRQEYHAYDVLEHNLRACAAAKPIFPLRLAALLHDMGKPFVQREDGHMYGHDLLGAGMAETALRELGYGEELAALVAGLIRCHMFDLKGEAKEKTLAKRFAAWGWPFTELFIALREADVYGSGRTPPGTPVATAERFKRVLAELP